MPWPAICPCSTLCAREKQHKQASPGLVSRYHPGSSALALFSLLGSSCASLMLVSAAHNLLCCWESVAFSLLWAHSVQSSY